MIGDIPQRTVLQESEEPTNGELEEEQEKEDLQEDDD